MPTTFQVFWPGSQLVADGQARELPARAAADDDLVGAELEHPAFDDRDFVADLRSPAARRRASARWPRCWWLIFGRSMMT